MSDCFTSDFEVTTSNTGNPFDETNKAVCLGYQFDDGASLCTFGVNNLGEDLLTQHKLCIFFNAKFDLHWYRRLGVKMPTKVWCCQLAEFLLSGQTERFPSLNKACEKYNLPIKLDVVKTEYWDKNIDTDCIPKDVLEEYAKHDVNLTYQVYLRQLEQFNKNQPLYQLFKLLCLDLLVLQEMEWNGLVFDSTLCQQRSEEVNKELTTIQQQLSSVYPDIPINFGSGDQLSAFLYGGIVKEEYKEPIGFFKTGIRKGEPKYKNAVKEHQLPRLVTPLKKTELAKEGFWKTDESTLRQLKGAAAKKYVGPLLRLAELSKLDGTYYKGMININKEMNWPENKIHGQFNQCVAATGRLSSSKPNLQNFAGDCQDIFVSRYGSS